MSENPDIPTVVHATMDIALPLLRPLVRAEVKADLRAQVEQLEPPVPSTGYRQGWDDAIEAVLALLGGNDGVV